ncbi:hypothetical protein [Allorhizobium borbori]|uniref:Uncharacterized protein n=1 Tax=Allorhizobium borbori TaxID=485907 RepID=A0A7W6K1K1_9HYPH|nr:hypothetical protein [Allorhizobium borbori]MBB4102410.1 hypothetical protein [Allorhizobium borbori]
MNEARLAQIADAKTKLLAVHVALSDVSSDIDTLHDDEVDAERQEDDADLFSAKVESALLSAYEQTAAALEALDVSIAELSKIKEGDVGDYASQWFPELNEED